MDQYGSVTYSNRLPSDPGTVQALTIIDAPAAPTALDRRTMEIIEAERQEQSGDQQAGPGSTAVGEPDSAPRDIYGRYGRELDYPSRRFGSGEPASAPRITGRPTIQPETTQDPCLTSSDPKCIERNRNAYVPYLGYAPSAARAKPDGAPGTGTTGGTSGGGAVAKWVGPAPAAVTPQQGSQTLRLRNSLKDAKDLR